MPAIVIDLDGTMCDCAHREEFAQAGQWDEFHSRLDKDQIHRDVEFLLDLVAASWGARDFGEQCEVIVVSGRDAKYQLQTMNWLIQHNVPATQVLLRPTGDFSPDHELKPFLLERYYGSKSAVLENVRIVLDDRDEVVEAWRNYGLPCWQVRLGTY